jgi:spermidine/putrescine transport system substrate-binding protein
MAKLKKRLIRTVVTLFWIAVFFTPLYWRSMEVLPHQDKSITIFAWGDILEPSVVAEFEKKTGIKVHLNYYSSNEEMLVKVKATRGEGYDLIVPSDYAVEILIRENLLQQIDKSAINFYTQINPILLRQSFDPQNRYSIPFEWELYGFGIDKDYFKTHPLDPSWNMVFNTAQMDYKIGMLNDPIQTVQLAAFYLYGFVNQLTDEQLEGVKQLLIDQKPKVAAYADFRGDYFLTTRNCPVILAQSSYIWRAMKQFDFVGFAIPKEGSVVAIENMAIPIGSKKQDLVYQFLNFLYRPESIATHFDTFGFFPATLDVIPLLKLDAQSKAIIQCSPAEFKKYYFTELLTTQEKVIDLWIDVKTNGK